MTVSQTFLVLDALESFEEYRSGICRMPFNWGASGVFLIVKLNLGVEDHRGKVASSYHI